MLQHHARLSCKCDEHGDHITHLVSADDSAWLMARMLRAILRDGGLRGVEVSTWTAHENGPPSNFNASDEAPPVDRLT